MMWYGQDTEPPSRGSSLAPRDMKVSYTISEVVRNMQWKSIISPPNSAEKGRLELNYRRTIHKPADAVISPDFHALFWS